MQCMEFLACGRIAVTNPSPPVDHYFNDYCHEVHNADLFAHLKLGPSADDLAGWDTFWPNTLGLIV